MKRLPLVIAVALLPACAIAAAPAAAGATGSLVPPPGFTAAISRDSKTTRACNKVPPPFTGELKFPSKYEGSDSSRDKLNVKSDAKYKQMTQPITDMEKEVVAMTGAFLHSGDPATLECALDWLNTWATADAMEDRTKDHTGKSVRKWMLAAIASSWVRLKFSSSHPLDSSDREKVKNIEAWLDKLGTLVKDDWRDQPLDKVNNHHYWAAWAAMADAVALNRRDLFDWSVDIYRTAMRSQVDGDGFLPNELKRQTRALNYHNYALEPLAMIAAFAQANGVSLAGEGNNGLQRIASRVLAGADDPQLFEGKTGAKQEMEDLKEPDHFAWLEPYCTLYDCSAGPIAQRLQKSRPLKASRMGGDVTELFAKK